MIKEVKPPDVIDLEQLHKDKIFSVFLAGSIEMNTAKDWQKEFKEKLDKSLVGKAKERMLLMNPRRDDWDSSWEQDSPQFIEQVNWELNSLDHCSQIVMYFDPATKSPITLLELGMYAASGKLVVCCNDKYWRKGNVDVVCNRYSIPMVADLKQLIEFTLTKYSHIKAW